MPTLNQPRLRIEGIGILDSKRNEIVTKLCPLMSVSRPQFWGNLPDKDVDETLDTAFE